LGKRIPNKNAFYGLWVKFGTGRTVVVYVHNTAKNLRRNRTREHSFWEGLTKDIKRSLKTQGFGGEAVN